MNNLFVRYLVATLVGAVVAVLVVILVEGAGHVIFPPPAGLDITDPADQSRLMKDIPIGAKIAVVLAWFLASLAGAWTAIRIGRGVTPGWLVALLMVAMSGWTTQQFPHPTWMMVSAFVLPLVGALIARRLLAARFNL